MLCTGVHSTEQQTRIVQALLRAGYAHMCTRADNSQHIQSARTDLVKTCHVKIASTNAHNSTEGNAGTADCCRGFLLVPKLHDDDNFGVDDTSSKLVERGFPPHSPVCEHTVPWLNDQRPSGHLGSSSERDDIEWRELPVEAEACDNQNANINANLN